MDYVKTFRDLQVYMLARLLAKEKFEATKDFSFVERFSLADRMRPIISLGRSTDCRSPPTRDRFGGQAWAKIRYVSHFVSKLTDGDGEQQETQHLAWDCPRMWISK